MSCTWILGYTGKTFMNRARRYSSLAASLEGTITPPVKVQHTQLLINGKFIDSASGKKFPTLDPRTGEVIAQVAEGDVEDVNRAVVAARKAFDEGPWSRMTAYISPSSADQGEMLCSLNFASRVRGIEGGPARKQADVSIHLNSSS
ncbi:unnamed protein product [Eruca vesicaria subsp. sativa]|uniref:Aldehyde dehydrogenase domain-containing protein n=1 Tax=Eruca vesicaria subsp. sativa TaxID=29727 RepID=A0ABC8L2R5_ERUVS|nr:unnamed protein product [Eruca vesicaria subsp. sativa]